MVEVVMTYQNQIDRREILESNPRRPVSFRSIPRQWAHPLRPNGIDQNVQTLGLHENRRVIHERYSQLAARDPGRRCVGGRLLPVVPVTTVMPGCCVPDCVLELVVRC